MATQLAHLPRPDSGGAVRQAARAVVMVRPQAFHPNPQTADDNAFQAMDADADRSCLTISARREFDHAVATLRREGIEVIVFDDTPGEEKPDAVFPNNWLSTHPDGRIVLYPMYAPIRRRERRGDVVEHLSQRFRVREVVDLTGFEAEGRYLEGTGSMVLDHVHRIAYAGWSRRTDPVALARFCDMLGYEAMAFATADGRGRPVYHTNVLMMVGTATALVGLALIANPSSRAAVRGRLAETGRAVVAIDRAQVAAFAGNVIELDNGRETLLVMSQRAEASLRRDQRRAIERHARIVSFPLPTIELGGGSARCMMATVHLAPL